MKFNIKRLKYEFPKTYYSLTIFELTVVDTFQIWSINITILNLFVQILKEKNNSK